MSGFSYDPDADAPPEAFYGKGERAPVALVSEHAKKRGLNPLLLMAPAAAQAFDAYTTSQNLKKGGMREANPILEPFAGNDAALYATKIGTGLLAGILADRLAKSGHRTAAKVLSGLEIAVPLGAGVSNAVQGRKR